MKPYHDILEDVLNNGTLTGNRTETAAYRMTGAMFKHDMRTGFPLLTTKKINPRTVFAELEFFIKGLTDKKWLQERNCNIWNSWANPEKVQYSHDPDIQQKMMDESDLGEIYGYVWNHWDINEDVISIEPKQFEGSLEPTYPLFPLQPEHDTIFKGQIFDSINYGKYVVLSESKSIAGKQYFNIQFMLTGYIKHNVRMDVITKGNVKDIYYPKVHNVGWIGNVDTAKGLNKKLYKTWSHMLDRCFNVKCKEYPLYGGNGITVDYRWRSFENFVTDVKYLPGWVAKQRNWDNYQLDKDYFGSNVYSVNTCACISTSHNILYRTSKPFRAITPNGDSKVYISITKCANDYDLSHSKISAVLHGKRDHHKQFKFEYINSDKLWRYRLPVNQLHNAIHTLKTNPTDRRNITLAWNPAVMHKQALPPCHFGFQITSDGEYVDLTWFQRSVDTFLGLPFNIASYGMLLELIARTVGMKARYLVGQLVDVHIYENHIEQVNLQLSRDPYKLPILKLPDDVNIFDWEYDQYELIGYEHHPFIKAPIAV
jgi:thymidylate synthase